MINMHTISLDLEREFAQFVTYRHLAGWELKVHKKHVEKFEGQYPPQLHLTISTISSDE